MFVISHTHEHSLLFSMTNCFPHGHCSRPVVFFSFFFHSLSLSVSTIFGRRRRRRCYVHICVFVFELANALTNQSRKIYYVLCLLHVFRCRCYCAFVACVTFLLQHSLSLHLHKFIRLFFCTFANIFIHSDESEWNAVYELKAMMIFFLVAHSTCTY